MRGGSSSVVFFRTLNSQLSTLNSPPESNCQSDFDRYFPRPMPRSIARRKTKKSAAKRFKVTATGKIMRRKPGLRHLASSKSSKRKRKLGKDGEVHKTMLPRIRECLPFA